MVIEICAPIIHLQNLLCLSNISHVSLRCKMRGVGVSERLRHRMGERLARGFWILGVVEKVCRSATSTERGDSCFTIPLSVALRLPSDQANIHFKIVGYCVNFQQQQQNKILTKSGYFAKITPRHQLRQTTSFSNGRRRSSHPAAGQ